MSILVRFSPPSMTAEQYDAIVERMYKEGVHPDPGLELELCFGSGDQMKVSLLFDSKEHFESFGAKIKDDSDQIALLSIQGPKALQAMQSLTDLNLNS